MRNRLLLVGMLLASVLLFSQDVGERPVYPGKTIYVTPSLETGFLFPISADSQERGYSIKASLDLNDVPFRANWGFSGFYGYNPSYFEGLSNQYGFGFHGGYSFTLANFLRINPQAGLSWRWLPQSSSTDSQIYADLGSSLSIHLSDNTLIKGNASFAIPLQTEENPLFSLSFGISKSLPLTIGYPKVDFHIQVTPERFSPDDDGENDKLNVTLDIKGKYWAEKYFFTVYDSSGLPVYTDWKRGKAPDAFIWDGILDNGEYISSASEYSIKVEVVDIMGNRVAISQDILSDILVVYDNGKYRIKIPNIIFPPNSADFALLEETDLLFNRDIIQKIAEKLAKYPEYEIRIEGHGNIDNWDDPVEMRKEQDEVLIPLTEDRAQVIKEELVRLGLQDDRITVLGMGGASPLVPFSDVENRWKNRRVEFILLK